MISTFQPPGRVCLVPNAPITPTVSNGVHSAKTRTRPLASYMPLSFPAQNSRRASVGKLPYIIFAVSGETWSDLARPIAPREKVARRGPSFPRSREIDKRRWEERVMCL